MAHILVIEHDKEVRDLLDTELRAAGNAIRLASTAGEGLRLARTRCPDVVLLDSHLPECDALDDVVRALRLEARTAAVRIIVLAKTEATAERIMRVDHGVDDVLVTPFSMRDC